jgi:oligopeptidase B
MKTKNTVPTPIAPRHPQILSNHGDTRRDDYYWLNQRDNPEVIAYLEAENTYLESMMEHLKPLRESLFSEIVSRFKQDDQSVPYFLNGYYYLTRYEQGKEYPIYTRRWETLEAPEEIILDVNEYAKQYAYYAVSGLSLSPDNRYLAFGEDTQSRRIYTLRIKDLHTGLLREEQIPGVSGHAAWASDNHTIFYASKDLQTLRDCRIMRHTLGTPVEDDVEVFYEADESFHTFVSKSRSRKFILIGSSATVSDEYRYLPVDQPLGEFTLFQPRQRNLEYSVDHIADKFVIRTNHEAKNFRLMACRENATAIQYWQELIAHRPEVLLEHVELFNDYLVLGERIQGITRLRVKSWDEKTDHYIQFQEEAYVAFPGMNPEPNASFLRLGYTSLTTPASTYDYDFASRTMTLKRQEPVLGGFDSEDYISERVLLTVRDGTVVPVSIVYKKGFKKDGSGPLLLVGYGSYGISMDPYFSSVRLSLLNRGFAFAIAHIRGGEEMGRHWYETGKLLDKKNTFHDFIDCAEFLINNKYTSNKRLFASGGSAGGLLMGAVLNMRPDLWAGVVASVPFVDVVTTMLDESIPLTTFEYDEWGNPSDPEYYAYMKSYSPYDNVKAIEYPPLLVTTGLHDSQVQYWEPAKWVAKMRALKTDANPLLLWTNMETGHGGASGRFERYRETAMEYAFFLDLAGKLETD